MLSTTHFKMFMIPSSSFSSNNKICVLYQTLVVVQNQCTEEFALHTCNEDCLTKFKFDHVFCNRLLYSTYLSNRDVVVH